MVVLIENEKSLISVACFAILSAHYWGAFDSLGWILRIASNIYGSYDD